VEVKNQHRIPWLLVLAVLAVAVAIWLVLDWAHFGESTCGAMYRPATWRRQQFCSAFMRTRMLAAGALLLTAALVPYLEILRRRIGRS
jgi:hypothetical protein